jgi:ribosome-associated protein
MIGYKEQMGIIFDALEDKKATDIVMLDLTAVSDSLDYFVICSATSQPQMSALERHVLEKLLEVDVRAVNVEGPSPRWVLINLGAILVHIMTPVIFTISRVCGQMPNRCSVKVFALQ